MSSARQHSAWVQQFYGLPQKSMARMGCLMQTTRDKCRWELPRNAIASSNQRVFGLFSCAAFGTIEIKLWVMRFSYSACYFFGRNFLNPSTCDILWWGLVPHLLQSWSLPSSWMACGHDVPRVASSYWYCQQRLQNGVLHCISCARANSFASSFHTISAHTCSKCIPGAECAECTANLSNLAADFSDSKRTALRLFKQGPQFCNLFSMDTSTSLSRSFFSFWST